MTETTTPPVATPDQRAPRPHHALISRVLAVREQVERRNAGRGTLAGFRAASHQATQHQALSLTEPPLADLAHRLRPGARRAAGLTAQHLSTKHASGQPLGQSLARLNKNEHGTWPGYQAGGSLDPKSTGITNLVDSLPMLPVEEASLILSGLVGRCGRSGVTVDFYALADVLTFWGTGMDERSRNHRARLLSDFYGTYQDRTDRT